MTRSFGPVASPDGTRFCQVKSVPADLPVPPRLFDRTLLANRVSARTATSPDFVTELVLADLGERLAAIDRTFEAPLLLGPVTAGLSGTDGAPRLPLPFQIVPTSIAPTRSSGTSEVPDLPRNDYDLIVSVLDLQTINDVPGYLVRLRQHLRPDGLFIAAALGGRSLAELRSAWIEADSRLAGGAFARVAPFMDVRDAGGLLQRTGYALPVADVETHNVRYADPLALMRDIKAMGAANPMWEKPARLVTRAHLAAAIEAYPADPDGRVSATLEIIWMSGWAPDDSQQKPLAPGSAKVSLTSILGKNG